MTVLDFRWERDESDLTRSLIFGFVFALFFALFDSLKDDHDDPTAYTKLKYESDVLKRLDELGFTFMESKKNTDTYIKPGRFGKEKIKLVKTSYILKVVASEKYMRDFLKFV